MTVRFAAQVGEILRDLPDDYTPAHRYALLHVGPRSGPRHQRQGEHRAIREVLLDQGAHVDGSENPPHVECGAIGGGRLTLAGTIAGLGQWLGWRW